MTGSLVATGTASPLTDEQRRIVEWGDGPLVVIAGAGSGKTRVIVERVKWLLDTQPDLVPEQVLVLTYNVKAAKELGDRLEAALGLDARSRLQVSNFHSFCHGVLTKSSADAGLPAQPDVLDGIGQVLLLRDIRPTLPLLYYAGGSNPNWWLDQFVAFINRAKDELVTPGDFDDFVATERAVFEERYGPYDRALERLQAQGNLAPIREVRKDYADLRKKERAGEDAADDARSGRAGGRGSPVGCRRSGSRARPFSST